jgi:hypothetical protein
MDVISIDSFLRQVTDRERAKIDQIEQILIKGGNERTMVSSIIKIASDAQIDEFYFYIIRIMSKQSANSSKVIIRNIKGVISEYKEYTTVENS